MEIYQFPMTDEDIPEPKFKLLNSSQLLPSWVAKGSIVVIELWTVLIFLILPPLEKNCAIASLISSRVIFGKLSPVFMLTFFINVGVSLIKSV